MTNKIFVPLLRAFSIFCGHKKFLSSTFLINFTLSFLLFSFKLFLGLLLLHTIYQLPFIFFPSAVTSNWQFFSSFAIFFSQYCWSLLALNSWHGNLIPIISQKRCQFFFFLFVLSNVITTNLQNGIKIFFFKAHNTTQKYDEEDKLATKMRRVNEKYFWPP